MSLPTYLRARWLASRARRDIAASLRLRVRSDERLRLAGQRLDAIERLVGHA